MARESIALCLELLALHLKYMGNPIMMARNMSSCYPAMYRISPQELMEAQDEELITWLQDSAERKKGGTGPEVDGDSIGNCRNGAGI